MSGGLARSSQSGGGSREVRNLANLGETASTARVLNLSQIYLNSRHLEGYEANPLFRDSLLNRAILVKHTLRAGERELFAKRKRTATKIILPFDAQDLKLGGRSIFVDQIGFDSFANEYFRNNSSESGRDTEVLRLCDALPSLDPFLLREQLARFGYRPATCYLKITPNDIVRMTGIANDEIGRLVQMAFGATTDAGGGKLTDKILSNEVDVELLPLKDCLRLKDDEFSEGIFSWRGFLYFKWRYIELQHELRRVLHGLQSYQPSGKMTSELRQYLFDVRPRLAKRIIKAIYNVGATLGVYDTAYNALIRKSDPAPFRRFLLDGPNLFFELGESIGILSHISSFWMYRMGDRPGLKKLAPDEFADILADFEDSLTVVGPGTNLYQEAEFERP